MNVRAHLATCAFLSVALATAAHSTTWQVSPDGTGDALTIQAGVDSAAAGDTVQVAPAVYLEHVSLGKPLVLRSSGGSATTTIDGPLGSVPTVAVTVDGASVDGFTLTGGSFGLRLDGALGAFTAADCRLEETGSFSIALPADLVSSVVPSVTLVPHLSGNFDAIFLLSSTLSTSATWPVPPDGFVYATDQAGGGDVLTIAGPSSPVLKLLPGTILKFFDFTDILVGYGGQPGGIVADGVIFTSLRDDEVADTDGTTSPPLPGDWERIRLSVDARPDSCIFTGCEFRFGGRTSFGIDDMVLVDNAFAVFDSCVFRDGASAGLKIDGGEPAVTASTFSANKHAMDIQDPSTGTGISGNQVLPQTSYAALVAAGAVENVVGRSNFVPRTDGRLNALMINSSTITASTTWPVPPTDFVYAADSGFGGDVVNIAGASSPVLTLLPTTVFKFFNYTDIVVGLGGQPGGIVADGVIFTSLRDDEGGDTDGTSTPPQPGDWERVRLTVDAMPDSCIFTGCEFRYGGRISFGMDDMVLVDNASAVFDSCFFRDGASAGLKIDGGEPAVTACTFSGNDHAMDIQDPSTGAGVTGNTVLPQVRYAAFLAGGAVKNVVEQNAFTPRPDGRFNAVMINSSFITQSTTWPVPPNDFVYAMDWGEGGDVVVIAGPSAPVLTMLPGTVFKLLGYADVQAGYNGDPGGIVADSVVFTSLHDDVGGDTDGSPAPPQPANWERVRLTVDALSDSCIFTRCEFRYGGKISFGVDDVVRADSPSATFDRCVFFRGGNGGLHVYGPSAAPIVRECTFDSNVRGLRVTNNGRPILYDCSFVGNSTYGVEAAAFTDGFGDLDARYSWWGSADGPSGVGPGSGDPVSAHVLFDPWQGSQGMVPVRGATVLVHGFSLFGEMDPIDDYWREPGITYSHDVVPALLAFYGGGEVFQYSQASGLFEPVSAVDYPRLFVPTLYRPVSAGGHLVLVHDWDVPSVDLASGQAEAAGEALFAALISSEIVDGRPVVDLARPTRSTPSTSSVIAGAPRLPVRRSRDWRRTDLRSRRSRRSIRTTSTRPASLRTISSTIPPSRSGTTCSSRRTTTRNREAR